MYIIQSKPTNLYRNNQEKPVFFDFSSATSPYLRVTISVTTTRNSLWIVTAPKLNQYKLEPASLAQIESSEVIKYLLSWENPTTEKMSFLHPWKYCSFSASALLGEILYKCSSYQLGIHLNHTSFPKETWLTGVGQ